MGFCRAGLQAHLWVVLGHVQYVLYCDYTLQLGLPEGHIRLKIVPAGAAAAG